MPRMLWIGDDDPCNPFRLRWDVAPTWCRAGGFGTVIVTALNVVVYGGTTGGWTVGPVAPGGTAFAGVPANPLSGSIITRGPANPNPLKYYWSYFNTYTTSGATLAFAGPGTLNSHWTGSGNGAPPEPAGDGSSMGFFAYEFVGTDPYYDDDTMWVPGYYPSASATPWDLPLGGYGSAPDPGFLVGAPWLGGTAAEPWYATSEALPGYPTDAPSGAYAGQIYDGGGTVARRFTLADEDADYFAYFSTGSWLTDELLWVAGNRSARTVGPDNYHPRAWLFNGGSWFEHSPPVPPPYGRVELTGIAVTGPFDAWAVGIKRFTRVGSYTETDPGQIYIAHWDGVVWTVVDTPCWDGGSWLTAVHALGPNDVWAVGVAGGLLALHWDGTRWRDYSP